MWPQVMRAREESRHELVLSGNDIRDKIEKNDGLDLAIFQIPTLNYLDVHETPLKSVPDAIANLTNLQSLVLHSNQLEQVNTSIFALTKLKLLDLSRNRITGAIPQEINNLINLTTLNLSHNQIDKFPTITAALKLAIVDLSHNRLVEFPDLCYQKLVNLADIKLGDNAITEVPTQIDDLPALKVLELGGNKIKVLPGELGDCHKIKSLELKGNPITDRRLLKLIDQCRTKQIIDYVKQHCKKFTKRVGENDAKPSKKGHIKAEKSYKHTIRVHYADDETFRVVIDDSVRPVREHFIACIINDVTFTEETLKKFIQLQNTLHDDICQKRNASTIATHDFNKFPAGDLIYTTLPPGALKIYPLNRPGLMSGAQLFGRLQLEAQNLRKEKKRNTYSGIHKYLYLIEGQPLYPCLIDADKRVVSFPPITNSDVSKIDLNTKRILVEVTSSQSLNFCKLALENLLKLTTEVLDCDLDVTQVKTTDASGNLKVVFPSKSDLKFDDNSDIKIERD